MKPPGWLWQVAHPSVGRTPKAGQRGLLDVAALLGAYSHNQREAKVKVPTAIYEFTPPNGGPAISVSGLQDYSPGQPRKADVWKLGVPAEHAAAFGGHLEYGSYDSAVAALAQQFCGGDIGAARRCLVLKFDDRPSVG